MCISVGMTKRGIPQQFFLEVAAPYDGDECLIWPFTKGGRGYGQINVHGVGMCYVHRILCEIVSGPAPSPKHHAAHSCGRGQNGCVTNRHLSWKTPTQNAADKIIHGTSNRGEAHYKATLNVELVRVIRAMTESTTSEISKIIGVNYSTVRCVQDGISWSHVK